jgi:type IV pilus assembly protein PilW
MVAVVIGMIGILMMTSVFVQSQGQQRATSGSAGAQENALVALVTVERDVRMAGIGLVGLGCNNVRAYNSTMAPALLNFPPLPVNIARDVPAAGSDSITILYSGSAFGNIPTTLGVAMSTSDDALTVANGDGVVQGNLILISEPPSDCAIIQASADAVNAGAAWTIAHLPVPPFSFNPPLATNIFPAAGYNPGARVTNMGALVRREYFVQGARLMMRDRNAPDSAVAPQNPVELVEGVIAMRAQYGRDTSGDGFIDVYDNTAPANAAELVAIRIAVVARSAQMERIAVSPAVLPLWNGGTLANGGAIALDANAQRFRYRVYQTTIPLRNVIWTNN